MKKDPNIFLGHIIGSIQEIENFTNKVLKNEFLKDVKTQDAVIRRIEIIGEAIRNLPKEFRRKYSQIEWREIAGMRDRLIHQYFGVDLDLVWGVVKRDIPKLKKDILDII